MRYLVLKNATVHGLPLQIARISCTTVVCPAGLFSVNEEGGIEHAEDFSPLPVREAGAAANWCHR